jgi:CubicO group peptidase (beta-lactamase class C family)
MPRSLRALALALCAVLAAPLTSAGQGLLYGLFERYLDPLRQQTGIPGLSAAIVKDGVIAWERGFGLRDIERGIAVAPDTPFPVGGLTQTVATVLLGACVEQGLLNIDEPVTRWVPDFPTPQATVRQVLAHATSGEALGQFAYDPSRYAVLTTVAQACDPEPFRAKVNDAVLERLGMAASVPGQDLVVADNYARELFTEPQLQRFTAVLGRMAVPYRVDRSGRATRSEYGPRGMNAADGLISNARDLARFDAALDDAVLLSPATLAAAWTPANFTGTPLPTGLGWFVQNYQGERLIWHFSFIPDAYSALILKMPARRLTLILLANSDGLSTGANLEAGDVTASPFVKIFLRLFAS